ncbi:AfsR/SARP family transcriptional regulator [Leptothrix sp. BB-4]
MEIDVLSRPAVMADVVQAARRMLGAWDRAVTRPIATAETQPVAGERPAADPTRVLPFEQPLPAAAPWVQLPQLTVHMLDGLQLRIGDQRVLDLPHGKARSLLRVLLLQRRRPMSRQRLCSLLWPEADPAGARNSLHVTLHRLRRAVGDAGLIRHGDEGYQIVAPGDVWLDAEQFVLHAEVGALEDLRGNLDTAITEYEAAIALYRSDLLDDGEHEPALACDDQALRDRFNQVLERLARLRESRDDLHGCLRVSLRHLAIDPCNEQAHRRLMRCYARLGQVQLAERQFRACVDTLRRQLGVAPQAETVELHRRIGQGSVA